MKDLTNSFLTAIAQEVTWRVSHFYEFIENATQLIENLEVSFWEGDENWALLYRKNEFNENETICYVWHKYPLIFVLTGFKEKLSNNNYIIYVECEDFSKEEYKLDHTLLEYYLETGLNYSRFSIGDLWYNTNSI